MLIKHAVLTLLIILANSLSTALEFVSDGVVIEIQTVRGTYAELQGLLKTQIWWGDQKLAEQFAARFGGCLVNDQYDEVYFVYDYHTRFLRGPEAPVVWWEKYPSQRRKFHPNVSNGSLALYENPDPYVRAFAIVNPTRTIDPTTAEPVNLSDVTLFQVIASFDGRNAEYQNGAWYPILLFSAVRGDQRALSDCFQLLDAAGWTTPVLEQQKTLDPDALVELPEGSAEAWLNAQICGCRFVVIPEPRILDTAPEGPAIQD